MNRSCQMLNILHKQTNTETKKTNIFSDLFDVLNGFVFVNLKKCETNFQFILKISSKIGSFTMRQMSKACSETIIIIIAQKQNSYALASLLILSRVVSILTLRTFILLARCHNSHQVSLTLLLIIN